MVRNPKWTEEELILALDLFHRLPSGKISARNDEVIALSQYLNVLRAAEVLDAPRFRNPNGTALKLHNFARFDPTRTATGMNRREIGRGNLESLRGKARCTGETRS
jgi:5-methylcytosine-specific restriction enzyme A